MVRMLSRQQHYSRKGHLPACACSLFGRVIELSQAPVYESQLPLFMINHDLHTESKHQNLTESSA